MFGLERVKIDPGNTAFTPFDFVYYPFSHSFVSVLIWGALFGIVYYLLKKNLKGSILLGFLVLSHWILDLITHRPDLPLTIRGGTKVGFGLWNSILFTILVEGIIFALGAYMYIRSTRSKNKKGNLGLWALLIFLAVMYLLNVFGPPPHK